jgi:hypothetical protein
LICLQEVRDALLDASEFESKGALSGDSELTGGAQNANAAAPEGIRVDEVQVGIADERGARPRPHLEPIDGELVPVRAAPALAERRSASVAHRERAVRSPAPDAIGTRKDCDRGEHSLRDVLDVSHAEAREVAQGFSPVNDRVTVIV